MSQNTFIKKTDEFSSSLHSSFIKKIHAYETVSSTNELAKDLAQSGAEEGTVVLAQTQHKGRGRYDRVWQSPEGGVYLSVVLRPTAPVEKTSLLALVAALAVADSVQSFGADATIKWPNDVRVHGKKIAGILCESETTGRAVNCVIVGIGVNSNIQPTQFPLELRNQSTSLSIELQTSINYYEVLIKLFSWFEHYYLLFSENRYDDIIDEWKKRADTIGRMVDIQTASGHIKGLAIDIDPSGFLQMKKENDELVTITSGDCVYLSEL